MQYDPKKQTVSGEIKMAPKPIQQACKWTVMHIRLPEGMKVASINSATGASKPTILAKWRRYQMGRAGEGREV